MPDGVVSVRLAAQESYGLQDPAAQLKLVLVPIT